MRFALTTLAIAVIALLAGAVGAPYFIDWTQHRQAVETAFERLTGVRASFPGAIELRLLPSPFLRVQNPSLSSPQASLVAASLELQAGLTVFTGRTRHFRSVAFERPVVVLLDDAESAAAREHTSAAGADVSVDAVKISGGRLSRRLSNATDAIIVEGLDFNGSLDSLAGPLKGEFRIGSPANDALSGQIATGAGQGGRLAFQADLQIPADGMRVTFAGEVDDVGDVFEGLLAARDLKGAISAEGQADAPSADAIPWRAEARASVGGSAIALEDLKLRLGQPEGGVELGGKAEISGANGEQLSLLLAAASLDLDKALRGQEKRVARPLEAYRAVSSGIAWLQSHLGAGRRAAIRVTASNVLLGGQRFAGMSGAWRSERAAKPKIEAAIEAPGFLIASFDGSLDNKTGLAFAGSSKVETADFARLAAWASGGPAEQPGIDRGLASLLGRRPLVASGTVELSESSVSGRNLSLSVGESLFQGEASWSAASEGRRAKIAFDLSTPQLDVDSAPNLSALQNAAPDVDLSVALKAAAIRAKRQGAPSEVGGGLDIKFRRSAGELTFDRIFLKAPGDALLDAKGEANGESTSIEGRVEASHLDDLAKVAVGLVPIPAFAWVAHNGGALSPASVSFQAELAGLDQVGAGSLRKLSLEGKLGPLNLAASRTPDAGRERMKTVLDVKLPEASALLQMLAPGRRAPKFGTLHITASAIGEDSGRSEFSIAADGDAGTFGWSGMRDIVDGSPRLEGDAKLMLKNAANLPALAGIQVGRQNQNFPPAAFGGRVKATAEAIEIVNMSGSIGSTAVSGDLYWKAAPLLDPDQTDSIVREAANIVGASGGTNAGGFDGQLTVSSIDAGALLDFVAADAPGPQTPSSLGIEVASRLNTATPVSIAMSTPTLLLPGGAVAKDAGFRVTMQPGALSVSNFSAAFAGGRAGGQIEINGASESLSVSGEAELRHVAPPSPFTQGFVDANMKFATTGSSLSELASGLSGEGDVNASNLVLPRADPLALSRAAKTVLSADEPPGAERLKRMLSEELDKGALKIASLESPITMISGKLSARYADPASAASGTTLSWVLDLPADTSTLGVGFSADIPDRFWSGDRPVFSVQYVVSPHGSARALDVAALNSGLSAHALAQSTDRLETFEADIRERAYFLRRAKAERFLAEREAELAAFANEAAKEVEPPPISAPAPGRAEAPSPPALKSTPRPGRLAPDLEGLY